MTAIPVDACLTNMGGIKRVLLAPYDASKKPTLATDGKTIATVNLTGWKLFEFRKQSSSLATEATIDDGKGVKYCTNTAALAFARQDSDKRVAIMAAFLNETAAIVEDNNGKYWYLGYDNPVSCSALAGATGTAYGDANDYTLTLTDMSAELPFEVPSAIAEALLTA